MWRCWNRASNFDFVVVVAGGWPSLVPCLPAIICDCVTYLVWQHLSLQWLRVYCQSGRRPPESHNTLVQKKTCVLPDAHLRLLHDLAFGSYGSALYLSLLLKMRILEVAPLVVALPMVMPPSSIKPVLVLNLILVWQVHLSWLVLPPCLGISSRTYRHLVYIIIVDSKLSLIEFGGSTPPQFARSVFCS